MQGISLTKPNYSIPNRLFYQINQQTGEDVDTYPVGKIKQYRMFDLDSKKVLGEIDLKPYKANTYFSHNIDRPSLYIAYLKTYKQNSGIGTELIKFAENISKIAGCGGNMHLLATKLRNETTYPHIFYRKMGFKTESPWKNFVFDLCVLLGIKQCKKYEKITRMYK